MIAPSLAAALLVAAGVTAPAPALVHALATVAPSAERGALLAAIVARESGGRLDARDGRGAWCAMQIVTSPAHGAALLSDPLACLAEGAALLDVSATACPSAPVAIYARGRCDSPRGREISRDREALARRALRAALLATMPRIPLGCNLQENAQ